MEMERAISRISVTSWRKSAADLQDMRDQATSFGFEEDNHIRWDEWKTRGKDYLWRYWWSYSDEIRSLEGQEVILKTARFAETNGSLWVAGQREQKQLHEIIPVTDEDMLLFIFKEQDMRTVLSSSLGVAGSVFNKVMMAETSRQVAIAAIAVMRFQLENGHYPADLDSLVPKFVGAIPLDPVDDQPLRYRVEKDGNYTLYSVGENGVDDGGNPAVPANVKGSILYWLNYAALDWVWPQPADEKQVEDYFQHSDSKNN
jgi:hypothetical protein